jgi:hypothetical protein
VEHIDHRILQGSTLSNTQTVPPNQTISLLKMESECRFAAAWRITLQRADRADHHAPLVAGGAGTSVPIVDAAQYSYAAGQQTTPAWPPERSNPVFGAGFVNPAASLIVQVAWGMDAANPARLAAQWPALGASIVVVGSYVEVQAGSQGVADHTAEIQPVVTAQLAPWSGLPLHGSGELSIAGRVRVRPRADGPPPTWGGVSYVPDFARRVKIVLVQLDDTLGGATQSVPNNGDATCQLGWFDDQGNEIDSAMQGRFFPPAAGTPLYTPPVWHDVPAAATMLTVRGDQNFDGFALVHWRIAP